MVWQGFSWLLGQMKGLESNAGACSDSTWPHAGLECLLALLGFGQMITCRVVPAYSSTLQPRLVRVSGFWGHCLGFVSGALAHLAAKLIAFDPNLWVEFSGQS